MWDLWINFRFRIWFDVSSVLLRLEALDFLSWMYITKVTKHPHPKPTGSPQEGFIPPKGEHFSEDFAVSFQGCTLPETNSSHLKMDGFQ